MVKIQKSREAEELKSDAEEIAELEREIAAETGEEPQEFVEEDLEEDVSVEPVDKQETGEEPETEQIHGKPDKNSEDYHPAYVKLASKWGWKPDKGDKSPLEFIEHAQIAQKEKSRENKHLSNELREIKEQLLKVSQRYDQDDIRLEEQRLSELREKKKLYFDEGDEESYEKTAREIFNLESKIAARKKNVNGERTSGGTDDTPPEVKEWLAENEWYHDDPVMAAVANKIWDIENAKGKPYSKILEVIDADPKLSLLKNGLNGVKKTESEQEVRKRLPKVMSANGNSGSKSPVTRITQLDGELQKEFDAIVRQDCPNWKTNDEHRKMRDKLAASFLKTI